MKSIHILLLVFVCIMITLIFEHAVRLACQQTMGHWIVQMRQPFLLNILQLIEPYIPKDAPILDLFAGLGSTSHALSYLGYSRIVSLDAIDNGIFVSPSGTHTVRTFNGMHLPFPDKAFKAVLSVCSLHEAFYVDELIAEMARVSDIVIVVEHVIRSPLQCYSIPFFESLTSWHFVGHPHNNLPDHAWKSKFEAAGLSLIHDWDLDGVVFHHRMYILGSGSATIAS
jgi:SAM-dependent methyltransferase